MLPNMSHDYSQVQKCNDSCEYLDKTFGDVGLSQIDHVACAHPNEEIIEFYEKTFGMVNFWEAGEKQVFSENASLEAKVFTNQNNKVKMTFLNSKSNASGKISQINEFLH